MFPCDYRRRQGSMWLQQLLEDRKEKAPKAQFSKNPKPCILGEGVGKKKGGGGGGGESSEDASLVAFSAVGDFKV